MGPALAKTSRRSGSVTCV
uniref:Uncharacterized protein MANES_04G148000 n=1 Tax=Rhizophora mucronata TaxID=61149 RepID=A0A2P2JNC3_RHIMU